MNSDVTEISLPMTKGVVVMRNYLTTGQSRELQKILLSRGEFNTENPSLNKISPDAFLEMQDRAAELVVLEIKKDGQTMQFSKQWLYDLPVQDGNVIYEKINEVIQASNLSENAKKNS